jgi:hypothetical protein
MLLAITVFAFSAYATSFNSTGGTFLKDLLSEAAFTYELSSSNYLSFFDGGSKKIFMGVFLRVSATS